MGKKNSFVLIALLSALSLEILPAELCAEETSAGNTAKDNKSSSGEDAAPISPDVLKHPNFRRFNVRLTGGASFALGDDLKSRGLGEYGGQGLIGVDWVLANPLAFSVLVGYSAYSQGDSGALQDLFATVGFMLRLFADKNGAVGEKGGNPWGQLFIDAHFGYHNYERHDRAGYNVGIGYEFSLSKDFNLGPYFRFSHVPIPNNEEFSYMSASFGIQASVGGKFAPDDADSDGTEDDNDGCPLLAEDVDSFEDGDGCPDPDNDKDGVLDINDACPDIAGVATNRGCEENDNDKDGILNDKDKCPDEAEDKDGFEDKDGCRDADNDKDGISDTDDKCPMNAEDSDGFEDADGCPDKDNDQDGILDKEDKCPMIPETVNQLDDTDGCPDFVALTDDRLALSQSVFFDKKNAAVLDRSIPMLEEAASILKLRPDLKIRIEAHTDNALPKALSLKASSARAETVKAFLVKAGIDAARLSAAGIGQDKPIAFNKTKEGREKNNRIELLIEK